ncbi:MAG: GAF domain-containing protein [Microbacterium sp.]
MSAHGAAAVELCGLAREVLGAERVVLWRPSSGGTELVVAASDPGTGSGPAGALSLEREDSRDTSVLAFRAGRPMIQSVTTRISAEADLAGIRDQHDDEACVAGWPVVVEEETRAVLSCYWAGARGVSRRDVEILDRLARLAGPAAEPEEPPAPVDGTLHVAQAKLLGILAGSQRNVADRVAYVLANHLECAVVVLGAQRQVVATAGRPSLVAAVRQGIMDAGEGELAASCAHEPIPSSVLAEPGTRPYGWIVLSASVAGGGAELLRNGALALSAYWSWTEEQPLVATTVAPLMLLSVLQGDVGRPRLEIAYGLFGLSPGSELSLAVLDCTTPENAFRVSGRASGLREAGIDVVTGVAEAHLVTLLLRGASPGDLATAVEKALPGVAAQGSSGVFRGLEGLAGHRQEALLALDVARSMGRPVRFAELGRSAVLFHRLAGSDVRQLVDEILMPLRTAPGPGSHSLLDVVERVVAADGERGGDVAGSLGVCDAELSGALDDVRSLTDLDLRRVDDAGLLAMVVNWDRIGRGL